MGPLLAHLDALWLGALLALPVTLLVLIACRLGVRSPATRHALWLIALLALVAPAIVASTALPATIRAWSARITGTAPERPFPTDAPRASSPPRALHALASPSAQPTPSRHRPSAAIDLAIPTPSPVLAASSDVTSPAQSPIPKPVAKPAPSAPDQRARVGDLVTFLRASLAERLAPWTLGVRRALGELRDVPPLPPSIWLAGASAFLTLLLARLLLDRRVTRLALPATEPECAALNQAASSIGLKRPPQLVFVPSRVSPMVTCAGRKRLVMPRSLWRALDPDARQAVLLHELAHLRRKDHWVHWLSLTVGALYWWHPLVWIIRARLRDEADLCCDAWVTALRPERRRGYAETLIMTTAFLNVPGAQRCAAGLAMASPTKRKLARRITMVMTHTVRPKLSIHGSSLVTGAALLALLVMPGVACPPPDKPAPPAPAKVHADAPDSSTFERHMEHREDHPHADHRDVHDQRDARERRAERTREKLARLEAEAASLRDQMAQLAPPQPSRVSVSQTILHPAPPAPTPALSTTSSELALAYHLPAGRLEALTSLMVRSDVPVLVSPEHDRLIVHATRDQHAAFASFARLICPEGVTITDELGEPAGDALPLPRPTAPLARTPRAPRGPARASAQEQASASAPSASFARVDARRAREDAMKRAMEAQVQAVLRQSQQVEEQARRAYEEAERAYDQSERARDRADASREKAEREREKGAYEKAARAQAEAEAFEAKAEQLRRAAQELERRAQGVERQAQQLQRQAEQLEVKAQEFRRQDRDERRELEREHEHKHEFEREDECEDEREHGDSGHAR